MIFEKKHYLVLLAILGLAFILRFIGVNFGLPYLYHADEPVVVNHALAFGSGDFNPHFFRIPPLVSYLLFIVFGMYFLAGKIMGIFHEVSDFEQLFYSDPSSFYFLARIIFGVIAGTATVYFLYRLIAKNFDLGRALVSSFLLAICFLHVSDSHYVYADIPLVLILLIGFITIFHLTDNPDKLTQHLWVGFMVGLATATKYNGITLAIPYIYFSLVLSNRRKILIFWCFAGAASFLTYVLLNPFSLMDFEFFLNELKAESYAHQGGTDWLHHLKYSLANGLGWPMLLASIAGILIFFLHGARRFTQDPKIIKAGAFIIFIASYYLILVFAAQEYARYVLPLVPFIIYFAADFILWLPSVIKGNHAIIKSALTFCIIAIVTIPTLAHSMAYDKVMTAKDTRTLAKEWIEQNIPSGSRIALDIDFYMPRLSFSDNQLNQKRDEVSHNGVFSKSQIRRLDYLLTKSSKHVSSYELYFLSDQMDESTRPLFAKPVLPYNLDFLRKTNVDYVVCVRLRGQMERDGFYETLSKQTTRIVDFDPYKYPTGRFALDSQPLTGGPFLMKDVLSRDRNGQIIEVYQIK